MSRRQRKIDNLIIELKEAQGIFKNLNLDFVNLGMGWSSRPNQDTLNSIAATAAESFYKKLKPYLYNNYVSLWARDIHKKCNKLYYLICNKDIEDKDNVPKLGVICGSIDEIEQSQKTFYDLFTYKVIPEDEIQVRDNFPDVYVEKINFEYSFIRALILCLIFYLLDWIIFHYCKEQQWYGIGFNESQYMFFIELFIGTMAILYGARKWLKVLELGTIAYIKNKFFRASNMKRHYYRMLKVYLYE